MRSVIEKGVKEAPGGLTTLFPTLGSGFMDSHIEMIYRVEPLRYVYFSVHMLYNCKYLNWFSV